MKYIPLDNQPNVSLTRFESVAPSLKMDDRGFPHITWLEKKLGKNEVHYSFWDGLKWSYKITPLVYLSEEEIVSSSRALVLSREEQPVIAFSRKNSTGAVLSLVSYSQGWDFNELSVNYDVGWVGVEKYLGGKLVDFSSSSSSSSSLSSGSSSSSSNSSSSSSRDSSSSSSLSLSSLSSSSSSSRDSSSSSSSHSSSSSSSSSSISSLSSLSSSSSFGYSSSSSINSNSSSSSSSMNDAIYFVTVYDITNSRFVVYNVTDAEWRLLGFIETDDIDLMSSIRTTSSARKLGISYVLQNTSVKYNFIDLDDGGWSFNEFRVLNASLSYGQIIDMDADSYRGAENHSIMSVAWLSRTEDVFYVNNITCSDSGAEKPHDSINSVIESTIIDVSVSPEYIVNGYNKISIRLDEFNLPWMYATGSQTTLFYMDNPVTWVSELIDIEGIGSGIVPIYLTSAYLQEGLNIVIATDSWDIYYFEPDGDGFSVTDPEIYLFGCGEIKIPGGGSITGGAGIGDSGSMGGIPVIYPDPSSSFDITSSSSSQSLDPSFPSSSFSPHDNTLCDIEVFQGVGDEGFLKSYDVSGLSSQTLFVEFKTYYVRDRLQIFLDDTVALDTGYISTGNSYSQFSVCIPLDTDIVTISIDGSIGTLWVLKTTCGDGCGTSSDSSDSTPTSSSSIS